MIRKFRKKPVIIDVVLYDGSSTSVYCVIEMAGSSEGINNSPEGLYITTLEGIMRADVGDWILKGVNGEIYPCKPDIFAKTYEEVTDGIL